MYCKFCGKPIEDDSNFCRHCGASVRLVLTTTEADMFLNRMIEIEKKTFTQKSSMRFYVFTKDKHDILIYEKSLASCNMSNISYIIVVHVGTYLTINDNIRPTYSLLGIYNDQLDQISSVPLTEKLEIFDVEIGDWNHLVFRCRDPKSLQNLHTRSIDDCVRSFRESNL